MGKYIVRVTEKRVREVVVDASAPAEAKRRGLEKIGITAGGPCGAPRRNVL